MRRLQNALELLGWQDDVSTDAITSGISELVAKNSMPGNELGIVVFVTAGPNPSYVDLSDELPKRTTAIHTFPLRPAQWSQSRQTGLHLTVTPVKQIPAECLFPGMKYRSRLHWYLADQQAQKIHPGSRALLTNFQDQITETSTGNFFMVNQGTLVTPPAECLLPGISREVVMECARGLGLTIKEEYFPLKKIWDSEEAFVSSTPYCLLPVRQVNAKQIGDGSRRWCNRLLKAWEELVGCVIE